jgi:hypothetical protein
MIDPILQQGRVKVELAGRRVGRYPACGSRKIAGFFMHGYPWDRLRLPDPPWRIPVRRAAAGA